MPAPPYPAHGGSVEEQRALYEAAKQTAHAELSRMCARLEANKAAIFEAHMDILDDEVMDEDILAGIEGEQWTAQWAVEQVYEHYRAVLGNAPDARIRERAADLSDVKLRLLRILQGAPARGLDKMCIRDRLDDEGLREEIERYIKAGAGAAAAVERAAGIFAGRIRALDNDYMRERACDVLDACYRVVEALDDSCLLYTSPRRCCTSASRIHTPASRAGCSA